jgi:phage shock protein C
LYRSADDRWIAGVAAGVAEYFDVDPTIVRILWFISVFPSAGVTVLAYIIMIVVVPLGPQEWPAQSPWQPGGSPADFGGMPTPAASGAVPGSAPADGSYAAPAAGDPASTAQPGAAQPGAAQPGAAPFSTGPTPAGNPGWDWRFQGRPDRWQRRQERWERRMERRGSGGVVFGAILIVVGGLLAWHQIDPRLDLNFAWPVAIIALGVFLVASAVGRKGAD